MMWICDPNCKADCCGLISFPAGLVNNNRELMQVIPTKEHSIKGVPFTEQIFFLTADNKCVFLNRTTNKCMIYHQRPMVCRRFGTDKELLCAYLDMAGNPRTEREQKRVTRYMDKLTQKKLEKAMKDRQLPSQT